MGFNFVADITDLSSFV